MQRIARFSALLCRALTLVGAVAVLAMMLHISLDVVLRNLFRISMNTTPEIVARYYMVAIAFLPLGWLHLRNQMIAVEVLDFMLPPRLQQVQSVIIALAGMTIYAALAHVTFAKALKEARSGAFVELVSFKLPVWHSYFLPPVGFALAALACLLIALAALSPAVARGIEDHRT
jgi:TRAP-type C4-dicarboxylate transport system permease small subunit